MQLCLGMKPYLCIFEFSPIYQTVRNVKLCKIEMVSLCLGIFFTIGNVKNVFILQFKLFLANKNCTRQTGK